MKLFQVRRAITQLSYKHNEQINGLLQITIHLSIAILLINMYRTTNGILETCADNLTNLQNHVKSTEVETTKAIEILRKEPKIENDFSKAGNEIQKQEDIDARGFWTGVKAKAQHIFDDRLAKALMQFLKAENATSLIDLGAGMGLYSKEAMKLNIFTSCYDGNPNTIEISEGRCATVDLSKPIYFTQHDWALSLEVGEHIPMKFEYTFMSNLNRVNTKGVVLSWAVENQGGHGHVNNRNNDYIISKFESMGYKVDIDGQKVLRTAAKMQWFKNTIMVFKK